MAITPGNHVRLGERLGWSHRSIRHAYVLFAAVFEHRIGRLGIPGLEQGLRDV